jgi:hypothetical protein
MRRKVRESERNWEGRDRQEELPELTKSQWEEVIGLGNSLVDRQSGNEMMEMQTRLEHGGQ